MGNSAGESGRRARGREGSQKALQFGTGSTSPPVNAGISQPPDQTLVKNGCPTKIGKNSSREKSARVPRPQAGTPE